MSNRKITVSEYATEFKISPQAVYQQLNKGTLKAVEVDGKKYIEIDVTTGSGAVKQAFKPIEQDIEQTLSKHLNKQIKKLNKQLTKKDNQIEELNKQLIESIRSEKETLLKYIAELNQLRVPPPAKEDVIEVKEKKKKKKRKKK